MNIKKEITDLYRNSILEESEKLFEGKGILKTKMDDIAQKTGFSKATLYRYFKNKDEILFTIIQTKMESLLIVFKSIENNFGTIESKFKETSDALVDFQSKYPVYFEAMIGKVSMKIEGEDTPSVYRNIFLLGNEFNSIIGQMFFPDLHDKSQIEKKSFLIWSLLSGIIRMTSLKEEYVKMISKNRKEYLDFSFKEVFMIIQESKGIK